MFNLSFDDKEVRAATVIFEEDQGLVRLLSLALRSELHARVAPYPPSTEANRAAKGKTHYQRGLGSVYTRKSGGRTVRRTSEMASRKWQMSVQGTTARLWNTASYSGYLWDKTYQPSYHAARGWKTVQDAWDEMEQDGTIEKIKQELFGRD